MPSFTLVPSKKFEGDFRALPKKIQGQVLKALERLRQDPYQGRKLRGIEVGQWRFRVGDYRVRYDIAGSTVHLYLVRHRKDIYR